MTKKELCKGGCGRVLRSSSFVLNKIMREKICKRCNNKIGNNKWYDSKHEERRSNRRISRFSITSDEKKVLAKDKGWDRVNKTQAGLKTISKMINKKNIEEKLKTKLQKEKEIRKNKKFLEGLK